MKASAEQADRLHTFSHDLRNRLIGLQQVLERLKDPDSAEEREELVEYGEQQYFKALREVERLMDDLQVQRGVAVPDLSTFDLGALVQERLDMLRFRFERKGQLLELDLQDPVPVQADPRMIGDVLDALLSNASKFAPASSTIALRLRSEGPQVEFTVADHGVGLSVQDLEQVFVRFAWLSSRPTGGESQGRGTLARARDQAIAHGGTLTAASAGEGHGCTFTLRLPV